MSHLLVALESADLIWRDGMPYSARFDDIYFSGLGIDEAHYVFVKGNELIARWQLLPDSSDSVFVIVETGFGTGLNFLLVWSLWLAHAPQTARLYYFSCEKYPLSYDELARCFSLWPQFHEQASTLLAAYPSLTPGFHPLVFADGRVNLTLMLGDANESLQQWLISDDPRLQSQLTPHAVDAWFLDGFAPRKNLHLWSESLLKNIALLSKPGTTLATFSAARLVREGLQTQGFIVNKIKGFAQKKQMIVAKFNAMPETQVRRYRLTPWHAPQPRKCQKRSIILGAGLAGCYLAHSLAKRGWQVTLIDAQDGVAQGASGNSQAIFAPKFSAYRSPLTSFLLQAFLFAQPIYQRWLKRYSQLGDLSGILQFAANEREIAQATKLHAWLHAYPQLGLVLDKQQASAMAGIPLKTGGLFVPNAGWVDTPTFCQHLIDHPAIKWIPNHYVEDCVYVESCWQVAGYAAEVLVIANGFAANQFSQTADLPLKKIRGQMTWLESDAISQSLKMPLCGGGHVLPAIVGQHAIGASYHTGLSAVHHEAEDDIINLTKLATLPTEYPWPNKVRGYWAGVRGATPDYLPLVGPVPEVSVFRQRFAALASNAKAWIPAGGAFYPGLFICAGFGSRGLTTIPLSAEWLASLLNGEPSILPRPLIQAMAPARFLCKALANSPSP